MRPIYLTFVLDQTNKLTDALCTFPWSQAIDNMLDVLSSATSATTVDGGVLDIIIGAASGYCDYVVIESDHSAITRDDSKTYLRFRLELTAEQLVTIEKMVSEEGLDATFDEDPSVGLAVSVIQLESIEETCHMHAIVALMPALRLTPTVTVVRIDPAGSL